MSRKYSRNIEDFFGGDYDIIYADPPWDYRGRKQFGFAGDVGVDTGGSIMHYKTMKVKDICKIPIERISARDSLLFMWVPGPIMEDGFAVMNSWNFNYATVGFVWYKERPNPGYYTMSECELCLVGKKGKIPQPRGKRNIRQFLSKKRESHSSKPLEFRTRILEMFPQQKKIELFARTICNTFDAFGDEI